MEITNSSVSNKKQGSSNEKGEPRRKHSHEVKTKEIEKAKTKIKRKKKQCAYVAAMLIKYWKATRKEPIMDLCMIIAMYTQDIDAGLLYAVGYAAALTTNRYGMFENIDTLSRIILQNKDGEKALVKGTMNRGEWAHAFLLENGTVRVIKRSKFDITLESEIIAMNSGSYCDSLFIIDAKMRAYEIKNETAVRVTGLPDGIKIKDISCGDGFTVFLSECGRVFGMGENSNNGKLGLKRRTKKAKIPTEITFPNQSDSDKNRMIITMIHVSEYGWVAVDSNQRAWTVGDHLMKSLRDDYELLDPCISIVEPWHINDIRIVQIKCSRCHVISLDTEGRVYWFGRFSTDVSLSHVSSDFIPFSHRIKSIRSGYDSVACKDVTNEWYIWGYNSYNHLTGLCGCEAICKRTKSGGIISNPMRCEWKGLFDTTRVIDLQLGYWKAYVIVDLF